MMQFNHLLEILLAGDDIGAAPMTEVMRSIMTGEMSDARIAAFLIALRQKGERAEEIAAAAAVMRAYMMTIDCGRTRLVDTCGTGGDGMSTFNVSTTAALVAAAAGVSVAKHGNRSVSSSSGSADFLEAAGVNLALDAEKLVDCINRIGIGFLFAPQFHGAMRHVAGVRKDLGVRTIFNLLGPLANPAGADTQLIGVFDARWLTPMAEAAKRLDIKRAMVVHSDDGLDEISIAAPTQVLELKSEAIESYAVTPADFGVKVGRLDDIRVNNVSASLELARAVLDGEPGAARDMVVMNAGAVICLSGLAADWLQGAQRAAAAIDSGAAKDKLEALAKFSH